MKKVLQLTAIGKEGRFANWLVHYLVGKCYAESIGATVEIPAGWIGEELFEINDPHIKTVTDPFPAFFNLPHRIVDPCFTRENVKRFLKWKLNGDPNEERVYTAIHVRRGDFLTDPAFPIVSEKDLKDSAQAEFFVKKPLSLNPKIVSEDGNSDYLEDFQTLMLAHNVFVYPRSTFSQMAALLGDGRIWMPRDYTAGKTYCRFELVDPIKPVIFPTKNNDLP